MDDQGDIRDIYSNSKCESLLSDCELHTLLPVIDFQAKHYEIAKQQNLKILKGKFTKSEKVILTRNWNRFCQDFNCDFDTKLQLLGFFTYCNRYSKEDKKRVKRLISRENFLLRLAKDLPNRTTCHIHDTLRVICCPLRKRDSFTKSEKNLMWKLRFENNMKWIQIAEKLNCDPHSVHIFIDDNYNSEGQTFNKGMWSEDENQKFLNAMKVVLNTDDLTQHIFKKKIPITKVRDLAQINRSIFNCWNHWKDSLRWKIANFDQMTDNWSKRDSSKLIYCLRKFDFKNELNIDWDFIKQKFSNICSFNNLKRNWQILKTTVPHFNTKSYKEIIEYLYDNFLPTVVKTVDDFKELEDFCADPPFDDF